MAPAMTRDPEGGDRPPLRIAVIGTPRSGNTWLRAMLAAFYGLEQGSAHSPDLVDWPNLPHRYVFQIHCYPDQDTLSLLREHGVAVVSPARHPLDALASYLNYVYYVHEDGYCPGACDDCGIVGVPPRSPEFLGYALGELGRTLLCYSAAWWSRPETARVRYEDLVAAPAAALAILAEQIGEPLGRPIAEVVEATSIGRMKPDEGAWQYHFWQGRPGLWRSLFPGDVARSIAANVPEAFGSLGYPCDPDETLTPDLADRNWLGLQLSSTREHLALEKRKHRKARADLATVREALGHAERSVSAADERRDRANARLALVEPGLAKAEARLAQAEADLAAALERLAPFERVGPRLLHLALRLKRIQGKLWRVDAPARGLLAGRPHWGRTGARLAESRLSLASADRERVPSDDQPLGRTYAGRNSEHE